MSARVEIGAVLATIPGWQGASFSELEGGLNNRTYQVRRDERRGVLKIDEAERGVPFNTRRVESQVQSAAADAGLAGRVLFVSERVYLTEYIEGDVWVRSSLGEDGNLEKIADALRRLHALPLTGRSFDPTAAARHYIQHIENQDPQLLEYCTDVIAKSHLSKNLSCCHNDLVVDNIIAVPQLMFLDWEYACDNDPLFDLATIIEHHELSECQVSCLLGRYFGGDEGRSRDRLAEQQILYLVLLWLWLASRPDGDQAELARVGERVITSCS